MASKFPDLENFTYDGVALSLNESDLGKCKTDLEITTWIVDQLRICSFGNVHKLFASSNKVGHTRSDTVAPNHFLIYC